MEDFNFESILNSLKQLFNNINARKDKKEQREVSTKFVGFQPPFKGVLRNSGAFDPTGKGSVGRVHQGIDLRAPGGTSIFPIAPGLVEKVYNDPKGGNAIVINHQNGFSSYYAHLGAAFVHPGDTVDYNSILGVAGASGNSKGFPHLHFQTWHNGVLIDPASIIAIPPYTPFDAKKEQLWLPGAKEMANNWNLQDHLKSKPSVG